MLAALTLLPTLALVPPAPSPQEGGAWPRWRGPAHDGVSRELAWDPAGRAEPLWRAQVGLGSPTAGS